MKLDGAQSPQSATFVDEECFRRIQWRARRGLLENDLLLTQFLVSKDGHLSQLEHDGLAQLLELSDGELLDLILARKEPIGELETAAVQHVLNALRGLGKPKADLVPPDPVQHYLN